MARNFAINVIRMLFMGIDWVIYNLSSWLMQVIFDLANLPGATFRDTIGDFSKKIYLILAIFMTFKVIVSLLTYLVNPDNISDKQQGAGKLIIRILIVIVMLIVQPKVFDLMYRAQLPVLRTIPRLVLGMDTYTTGKDMTNVDVTNDGIKISWTVLRTFYQQNQACVENPSNTAPNFAPDDNSVPDNVIQLALNHVNDSCSEKSDGGIYQYNYMFFISTIAGGFLCFMLLGIAIQIAIRSFKLLILEMMAPIPIISYIDPKASKDGPFNNWIKAVLHTWLELFTNLAVVYLIIYLVSRVIIDRGSFMSYLGDTNGFRASLVVVFIILGLFSFARQAPKFVMDILGIKNTGSFGKAFGAALGVVRMPGNIANEVRESWVRDNAAGRNHNAFRVMGNALAGIGTTGMAISDGMNADKGQARAVTDHLNRRNQYLLNRDKRMADVNKQYEDFITDRFQKKGADIVVNGIDGMNPVTLNEFDNAWKTALANGDTTFDIGGRTYQTNSSDVEKARNDLIDAGTELWARGGATTRYIDGNGNVQTGTVSPADFESAAINDYLRSIRQTGGRTGHGRHTRYSRKPYTDRRKPTERHVTVENNRRQNRQS